MFEPVDDSNDRPAVATKIIESWTQEWHRNDGTKPSKLEGDKARMTMLRAAKSSSSKMCATCGRLHASKRKDGLCDGITASWTGGAKKNGKKGGSEPKSMSTG